MLKQYLNTLNDYFRLIENEEKNMDKASDIMAEAIKDGRLIHVFGTDPHSVSAGNELFFKGGGLVQINPIYDPAFELSHGAYRCSMCQTLEGLAPVIIDYYENIEAGDTIIIIAGYYTSFVMEEAIKKAKAKGLKVIVLTSVSGKTVPEILSLCDVVINNCSPEEDLLIECSGVKTAGASTVLNSVILNVLTAKIIEKLEKPLVWQGSRSAGQENAQLVYSYIGKIKHL